MRAADRVPARATAGQPGPPACRRTGLAGLAAIAGSLACTIAVAAAGPSLMAPALPGARGQPPWTLDLRLSPYLAVGLAAAGLALGTLGLALTLRAMRAGWTVCPRRVLLTGAIAAAVVGLLGPFGSSDFLSYAAYGRELVTGHNPYVVVPAALARLGDPVARAAGDWSGAPSVYGALASGVFGMASLAGGTSARLTVFVIDAVNVLAFVSTGLLLDRLARARGGPGARLRAALLWTCNPLLLQILVAGAHVDSLAVVFGVAAVAVLAPAGGVLAGGAATAAHGAHAEAPRAPGEALRAPGEAPRALLAGALAGLGFAVKPTMLLVGAGLAIGLARPPRAPAVRWLAAGFAVVAAADAVAMGRAGIADTMRASGMVSVGSPWRAVRALLSQVMAEPTADNIVRWCAVVLAAALALALLNRLRPHEHDAESALGHAVAGPSAQSAGSMTGAWAAFALALAWLVAWPYVLPWYDALAWALLPLLPASRLDWLLLARTAALGFGYLPARSAGVTIPGGLRWMEPVIRSAVTPAVLAGVAVLIAAGLARPERRKMVNRM